MKVEIQNIPIVTPEGAALRKILKPKPDSFLSKIDFSSLEMLVAARCKMADQNKELKKFLEGKKLLPSEKALAHYQAEQAYFELEDIALKYDSFTSLTPVRKDDVLTRDPRPYEKNGLTISPPQMRAAKLGEPIHGYVIAVWSPKTFKDGNGNSYQEFSGLYLLSEKPVQTS